MIQAKTEKTYQQLYQKEDWQPTAAVEFIPQLQDYNKENNLELNQIYNCDETALYYKAMPDRTLALWTETQTSGNQENQGNQEIQENQRQSNFTFHLQLEWHPQDLTTTHQQVSITKMFPLPHHEDTITGLQQQQECMDDSNNLQRMVSSGICPNSQEAPQRKEEEKAVLLLDNCPAYLPAENLTSQDRKITVLYLPKNTTSKIQPLDQGIISSFETKLS